MTNAALWIFGLSASGLFGGTIGSLLYAESDSGFFGVFGRDVRICMRPSVDCRAAKVSAIIRVINGNAALLKNCTTESMYYDVKNASAQCGLYGDSGAARQLAIAR